MENFILVIHVVIAICIVALILLQQGKGAEMGASFGSGASQTVFGSSGSGNFFSRATAFLATLFFATSFSLAVLSKQASAPDSIPVPAMEQQDAPDAPDSDIPTVDEAPAGNGAADTDIPAPPAPDSK